MNQHVFTLHYSHRHGDDITVFASRKAAQIARAEVVMNNLDEVFDVAIKNSIENAWDADEYDKCYDLYKEAVDDETLYIEDCQLRDAEVKDMCIIVDFETELVHQVKVWPYASEHGFARCGQAFCWTRPHPESATVCGAYFPKEERAVTCLQCIAVDTPP